MAATSSQPNGIQSKDIDSNGILNNGVQYQTPAVPIASLTPSLPQRSIAADVDHAKVASTAIKQLDSVEASLFTEDAVWRDLFSLTGTIRSFWGPQSIESAWKELASTHRPTEFTLIPGSSQIMHFGPTLSWVQATLTFRAHQEGHPPTKSFGVIRLLPDGEDSWKIWVLSTILDELEGFGDVENLDPLTPEQSQKERAENSIESGKNHFPCVIIGGGQGGLSVAGRLKALGVSSVILDRNKEVGDNWLLRYKSFKLHTNKTMSQLPFKRIWGSEYPYFLSRADIAEGYKRFVDLYGINVWTATSAQMASWDESKKVWTIQIEHAGRQQTISSRHLVFAIGVGSQIPKVPQYPNQDVFKGELLHSVNYSTADKWKGKRGVIIGTANTGHDIAEDMVAADLSSVTMVQRQRTEVFPLKFYKNVFDHLYNEEADIPLADKLNLALPFPLQRAHALAGIRMMADADTEYFEAIRKAGFNVEPYTDLLRVLCEKLGGHYFDVGATWKIVQGLIKIKQGIIASFTPTGLLFTDGSKLDADVIIFATGFEGNLRSAAAEVVGKEIGERLEDGWQVDAEGELRGLVKPMIGQENVWYIGGDITSSRFFSRFLALQIKAEVEGIPLDVYRKTPGKQ